MRNRDLLLIVFSTILLLGFIAYMYDFYLKTEKNDLIRRDMYFDSLVIEEQSLLKTRDTFIMRVLKHDDAVIRKRIQEMDVRLKKVEQELGNVKE